MVHTGKGKPLNYFDLLKVTGNKIGHGVLCCHRNLAFVIENLKFLQFPTNPI